MPLTDQQKSRGARSIIGWSQTDLARASGVATITVSNFERGTHYMIRNNKLAVWKAFADAGVVFTDNAIYYDPTPAGAATHD